MALTFAANGLCLFQRSSLRQTRRTVGKAKVLEATSEEDSCGGFDESVISSQIEAMVRNAGVTCLKTR